MKLIGKMVLTVIVMFTMANTTYAQNDVGNGNPRATAAKKQTAKNKPEGGGNSAGGKTKSGKYNAVMVHKQIALNKSEGGGNSGGGIQEGGGNTSGGIVEGGGTSSGGIVKVETSNKANATLAKQ